MTISHDSASTGGEGRSPSPPRRVRTIIGLAILVAGLSLGVAAAVLALSSTGDRVPAEAPESFAIDIATVQEPAPATTAPPTTLPPTTTPPTTALAASPAETPAPTPPTTSPPVPIPSSPEPSTPTIQVASGSLADVMGNEAPRPVRLIVPSLDIDTRIDSVGYDRRRDEMEVPRSADIAGWYEYGPSPGETGSAVISAHVDWGGKKGAFFNLRKVQPNALIVIEYSDGSSKKFAAVSLDSYNKEELPVDDLFDRSGDPVLTLITCGGAFNPSLRSYQDNVVVRAVERVNTDAHL